MMQRMAISESELRACVERRRPGYTLPQPFFVDPQLFELDLERIFRRHWLLAGPVCQIADPGQYFTYALADDSLVILRDEAGQVRAWHNVCRHRGSRICTEARGHVKRLVCPYHHWSYRLDGSFASGRHLPSSVDPDLLRLHSVHVREVAGLIFVCLANQPPAFESTAADLEAYLAPYDLPRTRICRQRREVIQANWKVVADNFWECYHCAVTHPEFCSVMSYAHAQNNERLAVERAEFERAWNAATLRIGHKVGTVPLSPSGLHQGGRLPIRPGFQTQSRNGQPVAPLLGTLKQYDGGITSFMHLPLIWYVINNDYALLTRFTPLAPLATELELTWLVRDDAVEGRDYDADSVCWLWQVTAEQDKTICENNQRGILSSRYEPGPYATSESAADAFVTWYLNELTRSSTDAAE